MHIKASCYLKKSFPLLAFIMTTLLVNLFTYVPGFAQNSKTISGHITNKETGLPLSSVSIHLKGTSQGTISDEKGFYSLQTPDNTILQFNFVGFDPVEISTNNGNNTLDVAMIPSTGSLDEVIVAGAVIKKRDLTGSVASISAEKIAQTPTTDINQAIQGKVPGVLVIASPQPGADASIKIRGNNSIQFGNNPIFVVDGVIIDGGFNTLNPDDIETMDVLKDASATAIYGSRGANGVVIITTKKGKRGVGKISYNTWIGWEKFSKKLKLMNAHDIYNLRVDAYANAYMEANPTADRQDYINRYLISDTSIAFADYEQNSYAKGDSYDWLDRVTRTGMQQNHSLSFSGGTDKGTYFISMNYTDQQGLIKTSDYQRYGGRINIDQYIKPWLKVGTNTQFTRTIQNVVDGSVFSAALTANPLLPIDTTGLYYLKWADIPNQDQYNPLRSLYIQNKQYSNRLLTSNYINLNPIKDLNIRSTFSMDYTDQQQYQYIPMITGQDKRNSYNGTADMYKSETTNLQWDNTATYNRHFGEHNLTAMIGTSMQKNESNYNQVTAHGFPNDDFGYKFLGGAYSKDQTVLASDFVTTTIMSYLARADYSYAGKYFATGTIRYDGSSKFGVNNKWGAFPSLALAWDMSKENFMSGFSWIDQLKWKLGYGIAGNQNIPNYAYLSIYRPVYTSGSVNYRSDGRLGNPNLKWERQKQLNLGLDLGVMHNRLNIGFNYFNINNDNLLMVEPLTKLSGFTNMVANIGALNNKGIEVNLGYKIIQNKDLQWDFNFNISSAKNKITKLYGQATAIYNKGGYTGVEIQRTGNLFVGQSINTIYAYKFEKIAQQSDMAALSYMNYNGRTVHPGDIVPVDINHDSIINDNDKYIVGNTDPKFYGGFGTDLTYKGFGLNIFFNYNYGLKRISGLYEGLLSSSGMSAASADLLNRWTPENTNTNIPRALYNGSRFNISDVDLGVQNASFLRLSTFTLSYTLPKKVIERLSLDNVRFYLSGTNMWLLTKDKGFDPETGDGYPNSKSIIVGLNLSF